MTTNVTLWCKNEPRLTSQTNGARFGSTWMTWVSPEPYASSGLEIQKSPTPVCPRIASMRPKHCPDAKSAGLTRGWRLEAGGEGDGADNSDASQDGSCPGMAEGTVAMKTAAAAPRLAADGTTKGVMKRAPA